MIKLLQLPPMKFLNGLIVRHDHTQVTSLDFQFPIAGDHLFVGVEDKDEWIPRFIQLRVTKVKGGVKK